MNAWTRKNLVSLTAYWSWDVIDKTGMPDKEINAMTPTDYQLVMGSEMIKLLMILHGEEKGCHSQPNHCHRIRIV